MEFLFETYETPKAMIFKFTTSDIITLSTETDYTEEDMIIDWNN